MNVELKPIAESKVRQLGGDVCGVLVRTEDGVMAVSEHGRCTRLDAGVMGPVEPAGMNERELFEQRFPVPAGIYWNDISEQYDALPGAAGFDDVEIYHGQWMGWQAARAQGGQGADAVKWSDPAVDPIVSKLYRKFKEWNRQGFGADDVTWCEVRGYVAELLNTQPQPAQQGSVPHWKELEALADEYVEGYEFRGDEGDYQPTEQERFLIQDCVAGLMDEVHQMLKRAAPQQGSLPKGENDFGLDARYFHEKLSLILRDINSYTPTEMARALGRLAITANPETMREPEFSIRDLIDEPKYRDTTPQPPAGQEGEGDE